MGVFMRQYFANWLLRDWHEKQLLSTQQRLDIEQYESERSKKPVGLYAVTSIGSTGVLVGLLSLMAASWEFIPDAIKLASYFLGQTLLGLIILLFEKSRPLLTQVCTFLFMGFVLVGIGLFAQVYNLESEGWSGVLLWLVITAPIVYRSKSLISILPWWVGFYVCLTLWATTNKTLIPSNDLRLAVSFAVALFPLVLCELAYLVKWTSKEFWQPLRYASYLALGGALPVFADLVLTLRVELFNEAWNFWGALLPSIVLILVGFLRLKNASGRVDQYLCVSVFVAAAIYCGIVYFDPVQKLVGQVSGLAAFMFPVTLFTRAVLLAHLTALFNLLSFAIACRVVIIYFQLFGSLSTTGVGLMLSGGILLLICYVWHRLRVKLLQQTGGLE